MTEIQQGTIPLTDGERAALAVLADVLGYTREGETLQVETSEGTTFLIDPDGTVHEKKP